MTLIVNLFAGPGAGKSTTAAGLFHHLKMIGVNCELVTEYAKDLTWEERRGTLTNQPYIFGKQYNRMYRLLDKVDAIITDSPLPLSVYYDGNKSPESFRQSVVDIFKQMRNLNFFIQRSKRYVTTGRKQTEVEARNIDNELATLLEKYEVPYTLVPGTQSGLKKIIKIVEESL